MNFRIFVLVFIFFNAAFAQNTSEKQTEQETIPFILNASPTINIAVPSSQPISNSGNAEPLTPASSYTLASGTIQTNSRDTYKNIPKSELQELIKKMRDVVCTTFSDSDIRFWATLDASGKVLGVGVSTQSGIEITVHCKSKK